MTIPSAYRPEVGEFIQGLSDEALVAQSLAGGSDQFETLMRRHDQRLYRVCRSILSNDLEAEDAVQEAFLRAYRALSGFRGEPKFSAWLTRIAVHEALARLQWRAHFISVTPHPQPAEKKSVRDGLGEGLAEAIDSLPPNYRTVFVLRHVEEVSAEEAAASLNLSVEAVETRRIWARGLLQQKLRSDVIDNGARRIFSFVGSRSDHLVERTMREIGDGDRGLSPLIAD